MPRTEYGLRSEVFVKVGYFSFLEEFFMPRTEYGLRSELLVKVGYVFFPGGKNLDVVFIAIEIEREISSSISVGCFSGDKCFPLGFRLEGVLQVNNKNVLFEKLNFFTGQSSSCQQQKCFEI